MATIRERRPGVWEVRIFIGNDAQGRPAQVSRTVRGTEEDAKRRAAELTQQRPNTAGAHTVANLLDEWLRSNEASWSPLTSRDQRSRVAQIKADRIALKPVATLDASDVNHWMIRMRRAGTGESAIRNRRAVMRAALQQGVRWKWTAYNPVQGVDEGTSVKAPRPVMSNDDVERVERAAASLGDLAGLAIRLAAETGARRAELAAMRWDDVVDGRLVIAGRVVNASGGEGTQVTAVRRGRSGRRRVTLSPATAERVLALREQSAGSTPWIFGPEGTPPNPDRIGWWWQQARRLSGIGAHWRLDDLHHRFMALQMSDGGDSSFVVELPDHLGTVTHPGGRSSEAR